MGSPPSNHLKNVDPATVRDFGREWAAYDQSPIAADELAVHFGQYFSPFPWERLPEGAEGFDLGCGSGRWARFVAPRVGKLHCLDASPQALETARRNLAGHDNITFHNASAGDMPFADASLDFGFSLGVLHHIPDTAGGVKECGRVIRPGGVLLLYLYYRFDNRPWWYGGLWALSEIPRWIISRLPFGLKHTVAYAIALTVYWPLARLAGWLDRRGVDVTNFPLSNYRWQGLYSLKTDALDRFGTRLEQRFTRPEITKMLTDAGFGEIRFREEGPPFWCVSAIRRAG